MSQRDEAAKVLDLTHHISERGPATFNARQRLAAFLDTGTSYRGIKGDIVRLEGLVKPTLKLVRDREWEEWIVQWREKGKVNDMKSYHTTDKEDAERTMASMQRQIDANAPGYRLRKGVPQATIKQRRPVRYRRRSKSPSPRLTR